jgi:spermidine synthase
MLPWETLDRALAPDGAALTLARRGDEYVIRAGHVALMSSRAHASEDALGVRAAALCPPAGAVLLGGLGLGFTLRACLDGLSPDATVDIAELVPAVVRWNRGPLAPLARAPLADPRVRVLEGDVATPIASARARYDVIALDVDNGPNALVSRGNASLYGEAGLRRAQAALRPHGALLVWSAGEDPAFEQRLARVGFAVTRERVRAHGAGGGWHTLWVARRVVVSSAP